MCVCVCVCVLFFLGQVSHHEGAGGDLVFTDGFLVAEQLRQEEPEAFRLLSTHPVTYEERAPNHYHIKGIALAAQHTTFNTTVFVIYMNKCCYTYW